MKSKYMDSSIEHSLFAKTRSSVIKVGLIALIGTIITVSVHGCKDSKDYREYYNRGIALLEKGEHDHAISDFTKTIEMRPGFANAHFYRGRAYFGKREYNQAISDLNKAIEIDPGFAVAYGERAMIYYITKEYDKAWENIRKQESLGVPATPGFLKALREAPARDKAPAKDQPLREASGRR